ncbi:hypothetical protein [Romboutsia ilealis]|uniref:hypothetical protein n=1 Tax=Romboutsia ilealis TaxID=1115758 RepID=UPI00272CC5EB|nr:hypothetical protein [Romboutsia ilealis]
MNITALEIIGIFSVVLFAVWFLMSIQMKDNVKNTVQMISYGLILSLILYFAGYFFLMAVGWFMTQIGVFIFNDLIYTAVYFGFIYIWKDKQGLGRKKQLRS